MPESAYYTRPERVHTDGSNILISDADQSGEREVAALLEARWNCRLIAFPRLSRIDWYAERNERVVALIELKSRTHASGTYKTIWLNLRKYRALTTASEAFSHELCIPAAIFVVRFTDGIYFVDLANVDATRTRIGGCTRIVKSGNDIEPVIDVPISSLRRLDA